MAKFNVYIEADEWVEIIPDEELEAVEPEDREKFIGAWMQDSIRINLVAGWDEA